MEHENIYDKIMEVFGKIPDNFSILEEQVDIKTQMDYFEESKKIKENRPEKDDVFVNKDKLFNNDINIQEKKNILIQFANLDDVEAFRILEKFNEDVPDDLREWTALALQESRMTLESSLLNESQVIISTGLGGKGKKLRYFAVLAAKNEVYFTDLQERLIEKELEFCIRKNEGVLESVKFDDSYCLVTALIPLNVSIKELIRMAIDECNQIGDFINTKFLLTNVKVFTIDEIKESWSNAVD